MSDSDDDGLPEAGSDDVGPGSPPRKRKREEVEREHLHLPATTDSTGAHWDYRQKARLFRAVAKYGKHREAWEVIAGEVGEQRSSESVGAYLGLLEAAKTELETVEAMENVLGDLVGTRETAKRAKTVLYAKEVSSDEIEREEEQSARIAANEDTAWRQNAQNVEDGDEGTRPRDPFKSHRRVVESAISGTMLDVKRQRTLPDTQELFKLDVMDMLARKVFMKSDDAFITREVYDALFDHLVGFVSETIRLAFVAMLSAGDDDIDERHIASSFAAQRPFPNHDHSSELSRLLWTLEGRTAFHRLYGIDLVEAAPVAENAQFTLKERGRVGEDEVLYFSQEVHPWSPYPPAGYLEDAERNRRVEGERLRALEEINAGARTHFMSREFVDSSDLEAESGQDEDQLGGDSGSDLEGEERDELVGSDQSGNGGDSDTADSSAASNSDEQPDV